MLRWLALGACCPSPSRRGGAVSWGGAIRVHGSTGDGRLPTRTGDLLGALTGEPSRPRLGEQLLRRLSLFRLLSDLLGDRLGGPLGGRLGDLLGERRDFLEGERLTADLGGGTGLEVTRAMLGTLLFTLLPRLPRLSVESCVVLLRMPCRRGLGRRDRLPPLRTLSRDPICRAELPCSLLLPSPLSRCGDGRSTFS